MSLSHNLIVIDNFYTNAQGTREFILTQDFLVTGNFPGYRTTSYSNESLKKSFEKIIGKPITRFQIKTHTYNGSFQYTTEDTPIQVQRDSSRWVGILFLTPDAPVEGGLKLYKHKATGLQEITSKTPLIVQEMLNNDSSDLSKWEMVDFVGNRFNRMVLFKGTLSHTYSQNFGTNKHNGKLIQYFCFDVDSNAKIFSTPKDVSKETTNTQRVRTTPIRTLEPLKWKKPNKIKIAVLFFTTSRYEYLIPMMESFHEKIDFGDYEVYKILTDDYPARRQVDILENLVEKYNIDKLVLNEKNIGYGLSWKNAWSLVPDDIDYIWHQEDDFTFDSTINVADMVETFNTCPVGLTQVCIKRQIWFQSNDFIDKIEKGVYGTQINFGNRKVVIHQIYFNANPCIYPRWVIEEDYKYDPQEHTIVRELREKYPNKYSAMYGGALDKPLTRHIGDYTQGKKILKGQPAWETQAGYDPTKKYDSRKYLTEYKEQ